MRKQNQVKKLGREKSNREALIRNQMLTLFNSGKLNTTSVKAKVVRAKVLELMDRVDAYDNKVLAQRDLARTISIPETRVKFFNYLTKVENRGLKLVKVGFRKGDNAEVSLLTLVDYEKIVEKKAPKADKKAKKEEVKSTSHEVEAKAEDGTTPTRVEDKGGFKNITKKISQSFTGSKERVRTRSGI
jgi:large subunit ribosomal protein L17